MSAYLDEVEGQLVEWGKWAAQSGINLDVKSPSFFAITKKMAGDFRDRNEPQILDEDAEVIDAIVASLKSKDAELYQVARYCFIYRKPIREVAKKIHKSRTITNQYRHTVVAFVAGRLPDIS